MIQRSVLVGYLRDALAHLYDRPHLVGHPLGQLLLGRADAASADRLRRLLLETIEQLRPLTPCPPSARTWRRYRYLVLRYVEEARPEQIARELQISEREARREHGRALSAMAALLAARRPGLAEAGEEPLADGSPPGADLVPAEAAPALSSTAATDKAAGALIRVGLLPPTEPVSLAAVLDDALVILARLIELRQARVDLNLPADLKPVWVHRLVLRQVLIDLLGCAVEASAQARIRLSAVESAQGIVVEVAVRGQPISAPVLLPEIEARLTSSQRLIQLQAGSLHIARPEGHPLGAILLLPLARVRTLLVIDDDPDVAYLFSRFLRDHGYRILLATNAEAALRLAREASPDAITLDVLMPSQDGWDILRELASDPATRRIPVILCSVLPERILALSLGVTEFLDKPVTQPALLAALQRCITAPRPD